MVPFGQLGADDLVVDGFEGFAFRFGRRARVDLGGGEVDVAEDVADVGQRHARVVEMHRPTVAQDVRAQLRAGERRVGRLGLVFAQDPGDPAAAEFRVVLVEEHRAIVMAGAVESSLGEVGGEQRRRVGVDRDVPGFAAFAGQRDHRGVLEPDVPDSQIGGLLDAGGGVVEGRQEGRVTPALAGATVGQGEQQPGLLDGQVRDRRLVVFA